MDSQFLERILRNTKHYRRNIGIILLTFSRQSRFKYTPLDGFVLDFASSLHYYVIACIRIIAAASAVSRRKSYVHPSSFWLLESRLQHKRIIIFYNYYIYYHILNNDCRSPESALNFDSHKIFLYIYPITYPGW